MSTAGDNKKLNELKAKQDELKAAVKEGKSGISTGLTKIAEAKSKLDSFKTEIPEIPSIQGELEKLSSASDATSLADTIASIKSEYGSAIPDFDSSISDLGLDSFPPTVDMDKLQEKIPNVKKVNGELKEVAKESKPAEEAPAAPSKDNNTVVQEEIKPDTYELNKKVFGEAYHLAVGTISRKANKLFSRKKPCQEVFDYTWPELVRELANKGGLSFDKQARLDYTEEDLKRYQDKVVSRRNPKNWNFQTEGQIWQKEYDQLVSMAKEKGHVYKDAGSFIDAAKESIDRRKKKLGIT